MNTAAVQINNSIDQWLDIHFGDTSFNGRVFVGGRAVKSDGIRTIGKRSLTDIRPYVKLIRTTTKLDYYITANTVSGTHRRRDELFGLQNIVVDIDCHDGSTPQHVLSLVRAFIWRCRRDLWNGGIIPTPNSIVYTGRGIQLWWALVPCYGGRDYDVSLYYYNKIKRNIIGHIAAMLDEYSEEMGDLEIDHIASNNPVGYFRLPYTYNTTAKCYTSLEILHDRRYDQRDLAKIESPALPSDSEAAHGAKEYIPMQESDRRLLKALRYVGARRVMQLVNLRNLRDNEVGSELRDCFNFSVYNALRMTLDHDEAMARLREFNDGFKHPMTDRELDNCVSSAEKIGGYKYSNAKLIELLGITPEEQSAIGLFPYIRKRGAKPNASRDAIRAALREDRDQKIQELLKEGKSQAETARILGIGKNTVGRFVKRQRETETTDSTEPIVVPIVENSSRHHYGSIYVTARTKTVVGGGVLVLPVYDSDSS